MFLRTFLVCVFCSGLVAPFAAAQPAAEFTLNGTVRDQTGAVLVAADVTLTPAAGGERRTAVTDTSGRFEFRGLGRDVYQVTASAAGFADATQTVRIGNDAIASVELMLRLIVAEQVEVAADVRLSASAGLTATTLTGVALDALPDDPGSLLQRVRELAGATADSGQVTVRVDGFRQLLWLPPKQSIQAIRISSNWFAPEFAEPGEARIDIVTKPGSTNIRGDISANFNDEAMNAPNALAPEHPAGHELAITGYLSGPVVPRRWSFVVYRGYWTQQQNQVINATVLDANYQPATHLDTVGVPSRVDNLWIGSTYQITPLHTLAVSFSGTTERAGNLGLDNGLDLKERAYRRTAANRAVRTTLTSVPSTRLLNELRVQANPNDSTIRADNSSPAVLVFDAFNGGGNQGALFTATEHVDLDVADTVTLYAKKHSLKAGIEARSTNRRYIDATNAGGVFVFGADFERDAAGLPLGDATGQRPVISPLEHYRRTLLGLSGYTPTQFWLTRGNPEIAFRQTWVGAFAQDDWIATPRLTLSYGLRTEWQTASSQPAVGVRAGLARALDDGHKNVVRAGVGVFFHQIEPELTLDATRLDGRHQEQVVVDNPPFFPIVPTQISGEVMPLPTIYAKDDELRTPALLISAVSYERGVTDRTFLTLKYSFQHGDSLLRTRNINAPDVTGTPPLEQYGPVLQYESSGRLRRQEVMSGWRWDAGARGSFFANYSYIHARSDTDGRTTVAADPFRLDEELGPAAADRTHTATIGANMTLPAQVMVSPYLIAASGRVFNITTGFDNNGDGLFADRPALAVPGMPGAIDTPYGTFLADRPAGAPMVMRNAGRDPAAVRLDLRVARSFRYGTGGMFVIAGNVANVFNRANFEGVNGVVTSPSFGVPKRAGSPRRVNLAASFSF
jgi:hypothetical protein